MPRAGQGLGPTGGVLILRLGKLGDMMVTAALFRALRRAHPRARLGLVTLPRSLEFSRAFKELDEVHAWRPVALPLLALRLRGRWDWMLDLNELPSSRSRLARTLFKSRRNAVFASAGERAARGADLVMDAPPKESSHVLDRMAAAARALGLRAPAGGFTPLVPLDPGALSRARGEAAQGLRVALNLSAGHPSRYWPQDRWLGLAQALIEADPRVSLQILHDQRDLGLARSLASRLPAGRLRPYEGKGLWDFLLAIPANRLLISPDTSAVHAAGALGVPVLGLYPEPAWNLAGWGPRGPGDIALKSTDGGLQGLPLESVRAAALRALRTLRSPRTPRSRANA
jgi:ADP-heptose:LPS heptosyltransferase